MEGTMLWFNPVARNFVRTGERERLRVGQDWISCSGIAAGARG